MAVDHDFSTWPRRSEAAKALGISVATLRRYEDKLITPIKDKNGEHRFDPGELAALAATLRKRTARKAAKKLRPVAPPARPAPSGRAAIPAARVSGPATKRAFEMFEKGESRARVTMEIEETVENVNWLYEQWLAMSGRQSARPVESAGGGARPSSALAPQRPPKEPHWTSPEDILARPRETWTESDCEMIRVLEEIDERKRRFETDPGNTGTLKRQ
jgi:hypothetical protein